MPNVELEQSANNIELQEDNSSIVSTIQVPASKQETELDEVKILDTVSSMEPTSSQESDVR